MGRCLQIFVRLVVTKSITQHQISGEKIGAGQRQALGCLQCSNTNATCLKLEFQWSGTIRVVLIEYKNENCDLLIVS